MKSTTLVLAILLAACPVAAQPGEDAFFDADGVSIRYTVTGEGPPVVLLHGYTWSTEYNWQAVIPVLSREATVIGMDLRGHGKSGKPHVREAYGGELVEDVVRLMDHLGLEKAHVVGYSLGAWVALKLATRHPGRVASVGLGGGSLMNREQLEAIGGAYAQALEKHASVSEAFVPDPGAITEDVRDAIIAQLDTNDRIALMELIRTIGALAVSEDEARVISVPVLAVLGDADASLPHARHLAELLPGTRVVVLPGYHHLNAPVAPAFANAIRDFIRDVEHGVTH